MQGNNYRGPAYYAPPAGSSSGARPGGRPHRSPRPSGGTRTGRRTPLIKTGVAATAALWGLNLWVLGLVGLVGVVLLSLSAPPWHQAAAYLIDGGPLSLVGSVKVVPFIGDAIFRLFNNAAVAAGTLLMLFVNACQLNFLLREELKIKLPAKWEHRIFWSSIGGWAIEFLVALCAHFPYQGGWASFASDFPYIDSSYIILQELGSIAILMFNFEAFIWAGLTILYLVWATSKKLKTEAERRAR